MKETRSSKKHESEQDDERKAILDEREKLHRLFPESYSAEIGVWADGKVEVMLKLTLSQAESLARLLKENKL